MADTEPQITSAVEHLAASPYPRESVDAVKAQNPFWQQTMVRTSNLEASLAFFQNTLKMQLVDFYEFPQWSFSVHFLATLAPGMEGPPGPPGSAEAHQWLWTTDITTVELTYNIGSDETYVNGNVEPHRGFGHLAVFVDDLKASCEAWEEQGVAFQKKWNEGNMKTLAFIKSPVDEYWIEVIQRGGGAPEAHAGRINLSQTMIRVKDPARSLPFYGDLLGMTLVAEKHFPQWKFSLFFLANLTEAESAAFEGIDPTTEDAFAFMKTLWSPVLELTWNHGTELSDEPAYHNGNTDPRGFGHVGFLVDDLAATCEALDACGVPFQKRMEDGNMNGIAFALDPDNYWVELIQRGLSIE